VRIPAPLAIAIVVLVSLVWAGNFLASVFLPGYHPDSTLNFVFMTIVGGRWRSAAERAPSAASSRA
jgi:hypothetical protein